MGALHEGHATLVREARRRADFVVVSVFVNPTQFGPNEDLARYPRTFDADVALAEACGATAVFAPEARAMYPEGDETRVRVPATSKHLCGEFRPVHFEGVATVVTKLLALTGRCVATFGRKDYQQLQVVVRLVRDLFLPVEIVGVPTVREPDGLAMSSRNRYLDETARARARHIPEALGLAVRAFEGGERSAGALRALVRRHLAQVTSEIDYVEVADPDRVEPFADDARTGDRALLAIAAHLGGARLIDNVVLGEEGAPASPVGSG